MVGLEGQVMQTFAALFDETLDGAVGRGGFDQLNGGFAHLQYRHTRLLFRHLLDVRDFQAESIDPELLRLVDALHRDADVVDALDHIAPAFFNLAMSSSL